MPWIIVHVSVTPEAPPLVAKLKRSDVLLVFARVQRMHAKKVALSKSRHCVCDKFNPF